MYVLGWLGVFKSALRYLGSRAVAAVSVVDEKGVEEVVFGGYSVSV